MNTLLLFISIDGQDLFVGTLSSSFSKGKEFFSFEFSDEYLKNPNNPMIDPSLMRYRGKQYDFHFPNDMTPDRFGTLLIDKQEQINAVKENRVPIKLTLSDYLVRVNDLSRMGALRIKERMDGEFINSDENAIPPYIYLRDIEYASIELEDNKDINDDTYRRLLLPGSSLGGARPKASVYYEDDIYLAKFPSRNDEYDVELWEYITLQIAKELGINVPESKIEQYSKYGHTLLVKRFDREKGKRTHYLSAVTALGTTDGQSNNYSYLDLINFININSINPQNNLDELYRRMVFTYLINNTDNHLRNHAFIYDNKGFSLSPLFDVNPSFSLSSFELPFGLGNDKEGLIKIAKYLHIEENNAKEIYDSSKTKIIEMINDYMNKYPSINKEAIILLKMIENK